MEKRKHYANNVKFENFCEVLENIQRQKEKKLKTRLLDSFITELKIKAAVSLSEMDSNIYPILRMLLPAYDRERGAYNMKETMLGARLAKLLGLGKKSAAAEKLLNFRSSSKGGVDSDFPGVAYDTIKNILRNNASTLTMEDINSLLDKIANAEVGNKESSLELAFGRAIKNLSAKNFKWFLRIILKDLKLGLSKTSILDIIHPDAPEHYDTFGSLSKVCEEFDEGNARPMELGIQLFYAVSPMLLERLDITTESLAPNTDYYLETKFDGERFQIHMQNGTFEYFSRKGFKYSDCYGKTYDLGLLTPLLKTCINPNVTSFILDGEMMGWHKEDRYFGCKGMSFDVKKLTANSKFRPCFCAYDILYYNGKSLIGTSEKGGVPLKERLELLDTIFTNMEGVIQLSTRRTVRENSVVLEALNDAILSQQEGVVVKDVNSFYLPGRRNAVWYKVKPEYTEGAMTELDLVIIGADEAENKSQGRAKCYHVACIDNNVYGEPKYICVGRVSTGLTHAARLELNNDLERHWTRSTSATPPPRLVFNRAKPDFWIMPEHSTALEIRATELIRSSEYGTTHTLRFPRILHVRNDKPVSDVMTLGDFEKLVSKKGPVVKLSMSVIGNEQMTEPVVKKRKTRQVKQIAVAEHLRPLDVGPVEVVSKALLGRELHILSDDEDFTKSDIVRTILSHGGKHVENDSRDTWCHLVGRLNENIRMKIKTNQMDIMPTSWLRTLPPSDTPCTLSPLDMLSIKESTRLTLGREYDMFGDSYTDLIDENMLKKCFEKMDNEPESHLTLQEMLEIDKELFENEPWSFLRPCFINLMQVSFINEVKAKMYGANICDLDSKMLTHVVVSNTFSDVGIIKDQVSAPLVSEDWLVSCFLQKKLVSEQEFLI